jgi:hypothetical protein
MDSDEPVVTGKLRSSHHRPSSICSGTFAVIFEMSPTFWSISPPSSGQQGS